MVLDKFQKTGVHPKRINSKYAKINDELNILWNELDDGQLTVDEFLKTSQCYLSKKK